MMLSRGARAATRSSSRFYARQPRRYDSHGADHGHGHGESAFHVAGGTGSEGLGRGFYIALAVVPVSMIAYFLATSGENPPLTRFIDAYRAREEDVVRRNALHSTAVEQAAVDRQLYFGEKVATSGIDLRYPERFNMGSPDNNVPGDRADLRKLVAYYEKGIAAEEEARVSRMKDGKVVTVYDDTTGGRFPSWMPWIGSKKEVPPGYKE